MIESRWMRAFVAVTDKNWFDWRCLLLRSDVHRLYDRGYVTVTPDQRFLVSRRLKDDFENGEPYVPFHGQEIWMPSRADQRPRREFLEWHTDAVFRG